MMVPVMFEKSVHCTVALLAVLKAGAAIVPLDPGLPTSRLRLIIEDIKATTMLTSRKQRQRIPEGMGVADAIIVDEQLFHNLGEVSSSSGVVGHRAEETTPENAMYVIYTSGSTGKPKGVVVSHRAFCSSSHGFTQATSLTSNTLRVLQFASLTFDACIMEIFSTLTVGACLCVPSDADRMDDVARCIASMRVSWAFLTPSTASLINTGDVPSLKTLCLGGEALPQYLADAWAPCVQLLNVYGPTECSILNIISNPRVAGVQSIALGRPCNCAVWIVDKEFKQLVPIGAPGEIVIEGPSLANGYLNDPEKTAAAFIDDPEFLKRVAGTEGSKFYRTGDIGRMRPDGSIDYFGRQDTQIKIRGQRVELGEIEHQLKKCLDKPVEVAVELLKLSDGATPILAAFIANKSTVEVSARSANINLNEILLHSGSEKDDILRLTRDLSTRLTIALPTHMVPKAFVPCTIIPQTSSGKMDRKKLRMLGESMTLDQITSISSSKGLARVPISPKSARFENRSISPEATLRKIWAAVLHIPEESIKTGDDFFQIGGDSICAIKVAAACRQAKLKISVATMFRKPTLGGMAKLCEISASDTTDHGYDHEYLKPFSLIKDEDLEDVLDEASSQCDVDRTMIEDIFPCTYAQEGLMAVTMTRPGAYVAHFVHPLPNNVDVAKFKSIWETIHADSSALRTRFVATTQAGSLQVIIKSSIDWQTAHDLDTHVEAANADPILPGLPLSRFALITPAGQQQPTHFVWTAHHMIYDGWSVGAWLNRFNSMYRGDSVSPGPGLSINRFVAYIRSLDSAAQTQYWEKELHGCKPSTFPAVPRPGHLSLARAIVRDSVEVELQATTGLTMSTLVQAAWSIMISRFENKEDILFGAVLSGRNAPLNGIMDIEGPTLTAVPFRLYVDPDQAVTEFLKLVQKRATDVIPYEQTGMQAIRADTRRACEFRNVLVVQFAQWGGTLEDGAQEDGTSTTTEIILGKPLFQESSTSYPVTCEARLRGNGIDFEAYVDEVVTSRAVVAQALDETKIILTQLIAIVNSGLTNVRIREVSSEDDFEFTADSHETESSTTLNLTPDVSRRGSGMVMLPKAAQELVHSLISESAQSHPDAEAICFSGGSFSYAALEDMSTRLAEYLVRDMKLVKGSMVPLCFEKSPMAVVAMLAVLKAGGAFVPLDPALPLARLRQIVQTVDASVVLTSRLHARATALRIKNTVVVHPSTFKTLPKIETQSRVSTNHDDLAYIIFTSGSTGSPKGVMMSHRAFATSALAHAEPTGIFSGSRVLQYASYSFDASLVEILTTLIRGGCVCVPEESQRTDIRGLAAFMGQARVDITLLTPSVARLLNPSDVPLLKTINFVGEATDSTLFHKWLDAGLHVVNGYGPTECAVAVAAHTLTSGMNPRTLGQPHPGCMFWVCDPEDVHHLLDYSSGEVVEGELVVEGPVLANGYLKDATTTESSFVTNPYWTLNQDTSEMMCSRRVYKTGDLVRRDASGTLTYVGRKDHQIKVNGQRIEIGEIEACLSCFEGVSKSVVLFPSSGPFAKQLVAVVEVSDQEDARTQLERSIPEAMVPKYWVNMSLFTGRSQAQGNLVLNSSGKLDRKLLTDWLENMAPEEAGTILNHGDSTERAIIGKDELLAWGLAQKISSMLPGCDILKVHGGYRDVVLSSSGFDSLNMMTLIHHISSKFGAKVPIQVLMDKTTTIRALAKMIANRESNNVASPPKVDFEDEIEQYDAEITAIEQDIETKGPIQVKAASRTGVTVLLTGANGFLGTELLHQLLERRDTNRVIALARGTPSETAEQRVVNAACNARWWTKMHAEKLEVWAGDLEKDHLGLKPALWDRLNHGGEIDFVIHNGAVVNWNLPYEVLRKANVESTATLLGIAIRSNFGFSFVSGGIQGQYNSEMANANDGADHFPRKMTPVEVTASNGYAQTKYVAEHVVHRAAIRSQRQLRRTRISIIRPGLIIGTLNQGIANTNDFLWRLVSTCIRVGAYNASEADTILRLSDATTCASSVIDGTLVTSGETITTVYDGLTWGAFWSFISGGLGYTLIPMCARDWVETVRQDLGKLEEKHPMWPLAHMLGEMCDGGDPGCVRGSQTEPAPLHLKIAIQRNVEFLQSVGFLPAM